MNYVVKPISKYLVHEWFKKKHYAKRSPSTMSYTFGLFDSKNILVRVCAYGMPANGRCLMLCGANIIVGCEESQAVCIELRKAGHNAYSCDQQSCSGGHPEWHIISDIFLVLKGGWFTTQASNTVYIEKWQMAIFFPPCTYLTVTANGWLKDQPPLKSGALVGEARREARREAIKFFKDLAGADVAHIAIENPVGCMSQEYKKPSQIIHPYFFGDEARKTTCLWLKNIPLLYHNKTINLFDQEITHVSEGESAEWTCSKTGKKKRQPKWYASAKQGKELGDRSRERSKTFMGIARAMGEQWGAYLHEIYK